MIRPVAVITGGSSGIGRALVIKYANEGYAVSFTGRNEDRMKEVETELESLGCKEYLALRLDAASKEENQELIDKTVEAFGQLNVLVCNAGVSMRALFSDLDIDVFKQVMKINFYGALYATKFALPHILKTKGSIIGISSINGWRGTPARTAYTASKFAMQGFYEALRTEVMHQGVHILVACPSFTGTNIRNHALSVDGTVQGESPRDESKMMSTEEVASKIFKAMKKRKRDRVFTVYGWLTIFLNKWMPGRMDTIVYNVMKKEPGSPFA